MLYWKFAYAYSRVDLRKRKLIKEVITLALTTRQHIVETLTKKYFKRITTDCIEAAPKIEDAFEIQKEVVKRLKDLTNKE